MYQFLGTYFLLGGPSRCQDASSASVALGNAAANGKAHTKVGVAESVAQQLSMLVRCLGRHANYLRAHLLPGIPCEFVARDQLRCRS